MGPRAELGEVGQGRCATYQRARRDCRRERHLPHLVPEAPVHHPGRRLLRVATAGGDAHAAMVPGAHDDDAVLAMAGLWSPWKDPTTGLWVLSATVITTNANDDVARLHDRMPVILPRDAWATWLDPAEQDAELLRSLLEPAPDGVLEMHPVSRRVNDVREDGPQLIEAVTEERPSPRPATCRRHGGLAGVRPSPVRAPSSTRTRATPGRGAAAHAVGGPRLGRPSNLQHPPRAAWRAAGPRTSNTRPGPSPVNARLVASIRHPSKQPSALSASARSVRRRARCHPPAAAGADDS